TFVCAVLAAPSITRISPLLRFLSKEEIYPALRGGSAGSLALTAAAMAGNALMLAVAAALALRPLLGAAAHTPPEPHEGPPALWLGNGVARLGGMAYAIHAAPSNAAMTSQMARAFGGRTIAEHGAPALHSALHLPLSLVTIALGMAVWLG